MLRERDRRQLEPSFLACASGLPTAIRFREYQGWDGNGPTPSRLALVIRPITFSGVVVVGSLALAAIYIDEQQRKVGCTWAGQRRQRQGDIDFRGWRLSMPQFVCASIIAANGVVFACWTSSIRGVNSLEYAYLWLRKYFLHHAFSGRALPLIGRCVCVSIGCF